MYNINPNIKGISHIIKIHKKIFDSLFLASVYTHIDKAIETRNVITKKIINIKKINSIITLNFLDFDTYLSILLIILLKIFYWFKLRESCFTPPTSIFYLR